MSQGMSSAVKAKLTTKVMTNWMILTTSMGFQALRKEGGLRRSGARERLRRLRIPPFANGRRLARQMRQPTASAAKTKQRYKKRSNCKHKKSGCVCFIVARLRASALRNRGMGDNKVLCAPTNSTAKLRTYARTRKIHRNKNKNIFQHRTIHHTKRGGKKQDCPTITTNKGTVLHLLPHSARRRVIQFVRTPLRFALTLARAYAHSAVFRLLPSPFTPYPYPTQNMTIRGEGFAFVRSSPYSPEKRISTHPIFSCKASSVRRLHRGELLPIFLLHGNLHPYLADSLQFTSCRLLKIG